ncbi:MAG: DUF4358 domain-containing protein [Acutalibacteraceae bacterium]|nr:DUF4358 domain-containing protein [Acutalibacteraceae bacterium]HIR04324.1 DUF4358 domain-containing protein [Candidatus Scatovicinus merdipullorum]
MKKIYALLLAAVMLLGITGCVQEEKRISLEDVMAKIALTYDLPDEMVQIQSEEDLMNYYGIASGDVLQYQAQINGSGVEQDEIVMIQAKDSGAKAVVEAKLNERYQSKLSSTKNYLPDQYNMLKKCKVQTSGNYICMFLSKDAEGMTNIYNSYLKE